MCLYRCVSKLELLSLPSHLNRRVGCLQSVGIVLTIGGYFLGHAHGGRKFLDSAHGTFANVVMFFVAAQLGLGIYLKLHIHERSIRPYIVVLHGIIGKVFPVIGWTQMLFGAIAYMGYCRGGHLGQCLAHYIMVRVSVILAVSYLIHRCIQGEWVHRLRRPHVNPASRRRGVDTTERRKSRVLRLSSYHALGTLEFIDYPYSQAHRLGAGHRYALFKLAVRLPLNRGLRLS